mmetsp:Transcript_65483/g.142880  ORF Transcript_65483/g.142880 Transcript_65483/m.142880 type:complete len:233 (-) Transcript_65483:749-1447(-)
MNLPLKSQWSPSKLEARVTGVWCARGLEVAEFWREDLRRLSKGVSSILLHTNSFQRHGFGGVSTGSQTQEDCVCLPRSDWDEMQASVRLRVERELVADLSRVACRVRDAASSAVVAASVAATRFAAADQNHELTAASESSESVPGKRRGWRRGFRPSAPDSSTPRPEFKQTCSPIARHEQGGHWAENTLQQAGSSVQEKAARTLYISGLHPQTTAVEVSQMLRRAGGVEDVR